MRRTKHLAEAGHANSVTHLPRFPDRANGSGPRRLPHLTMDGGWPYANREVRESVEDKHSGRPDGAPPG